MRKLEGVIAPVVTTFDAASEDVVVDRFIANIRAHLAAGLDGIVVAGSTGEAALLEESERRQLLESARGAIPDDRILIAGIGGESARITIRRAKDANAAGADAVLVVSPHYYTSSMTPDALRAHFTRVADESPLPVLLYNIPKYAHFALSPELVRDLSRHENIVGMKDSAGDLDRFRGYLESQRDDFTVLTGHGGTFHTALQMGAHGGILAMSLFAAELTVELYETHIAGDASGAAHAQSLLTPLAAEIVGKLGVAGVKGAMDRVGLAGGRVRSPLLPLSEREGARVDELLRDARVTAGV